MSNAHLIVSGSIHEADRRFSDVSRGKNVLLSIFQPYYMQTPAVFRNGRPTQSIRY